MQGCAPADMAISPVFSWNDRVYQPRHKKVNFSCPPSCYLPITQQVRFFILAQGAGLMLNYFGFKPNPDAWHFASKIRGLLITAALIATLTRTSPVAGTTATTSPGGDILIVEGTNTSELIYVTGTGTFGEVWVDLNNNGVINSGETFSGIEFVLISALGGNDIVIVESPLKCTSVTIAPGNGNDFATVRGTVPMDSPIFLDSTTNSTTGSNFFSINQLQVTAIGANFGGDSSLLQCTNVTCGFVDLASTAGQSTFLFNDLVTDRFEYDALENLPNAVHIGIDNVTVTHQLSIDASTSDIAQLNVMAQNSHCGSCSIRGGTFADVVEIRSSSLGATEISTFDGDDSVSVVGITCGFGDFEIALGRDDDQVSVRDSRFTDSLLINGNSEKDEIIFDNNSSEQVSIGGNLEIRGGGGSDVLKANNVVVEGDTLTFGGSGHEIFAFENFIAEGSWSCALGSGQDQIEIRDSSFFGSFAAWGGGNIDSGTESNNQFSGSQTTGGFENGNL